MQDLFNYLQRINLNIHNLSISEIKSVETVHGYQCNVNNKDGSVLAGGTSKDKNIAIRIAIAEAFERLLALSIHRNEVLRDEFLLQHFPSSSGFAAGFDNNKTKFRAICEGLERWVWSKWIDEGFKLERFIPKKSFSNLANFLIQSFNETYWFEKKFDIKIEESKAIELKIVIFLGCTEEGVFPGSRVSTEADDLFEHSIIEAHRNFTNYHLHLESPLTLQDIIQERVIFYGSNKKLAFEQIDRATNIDWPEAKIRILKSLTTDHPNLFLYRCLFEDFIGWHEGDVTRFVY